MFTTETTARNRTFGEKQQSSDGIGQTSSALGVDMAGVPASDSLRGTDMPSRTATKTIKYSIATGLHRVCVCVCVCLCACVRVCVASETQTQISVHRSTQKKPEHKNIIVTAN